MSQFANLVLKRGVSAHRSRGRSPEVLPQRYPENRMVVMEMIGDACTTTPGRGLLSSFSREHIAQGGRMNHKMSQIQAEKEYEIA